MNALFNLARFAACIRFKRGDTGLRDAALEIAEFGCTVSASSISRWERGALPEMTAFVALCNWMGVSPSVFFSDADEVREPLPFDEG